MAKRSKVFDFDLIVIGSGAGGGVAAHIASRDGKSVAIVESGAIGGECPNYGCVPTKALLTAADTIRVAKKGPTFGVQTSGVRLSGRKLKAWKDLAVKRTGVSVGEQVFTSEGIKVLSGHAHFINDHTISVNKQRYSARYFLVATGTHNFVPPIEGLKEAGFLTHREAINLSSFPKSIFIIGGGAIGVEFAFMLNSFGVKVTIAEFDDRLLPREDKEVGQFAAGFFEKEGITVLASAEVRKVETSRGKKVVSYRQGGKAHKVSVDEILLAAGLHPNTDLGLENAKVKFNAHGITANHSMQTNQKHIYTAGDVTGPYAYTHVASYQSRIAVHNMFKKHKLIAKYHAIPRVTYTDPEIASVGMTEDQLKRQGIAFKTHATPIDIIGRANVADVHSGFVKVIVSKTDVLLGASIAAPHAGEMIHELALAVNLGLTAQDVASTIHAFPTWSQAVRIACAGI